MRFNQITIANFLSYGEEQTVDLDRQGLVGIFGNNIDSAFDSNGSGKSSILEAVVWVLWGETVRGLKGDEVINIKSKKNCEGSLTLEEGSKNYTITRYRAKEGVKKKNDLLLYVGDKEATAGTVSDTQVLINDIVGIDFQTFSQSVLLTAQTESFCTLPDSKQKEVLEDILNIDVLRKAHAYNKQKLIILESALSTAMAGLESVEDEKESVVALQGSLEAKSENFEVEKAGKKERIQITLKEAEKRLKACQKAAKSLEAIQEKVKTKDQESAGLVKELAEVKAELNAVEEKVSKSRQAVREKQIKAEAKIDYLKKSIYAMNNLAGKQCGSCGQTVDPDFAEDHITESEVEMKELKQSLNKLDLLLDRLEEAKNNDVGPLQQRAGEVKDKIHAYNVERAELINAATEFMKIAAGEEGCKESIEYIKKQLKEEDDAENPYTSLIEEGQKRLTEVKKRISAFKRKIASIEIDLKAHRFWDIGFGNKGLKSYIMDNVVPFLNQRAQRYADIMSDGALQIRFSTQTKNKDGSLREKFNVEVTNTSGADVYKGNSSGERRRADVAVGWALADLAATRAQKSIRFRGLDEPFENLDSEGIDAVFKLLQAAAEEYETIFVITHNTDLKPRFGKEIVVTKQAGYSRIE